MSEGGRPEVDPESIEGTAEKASPAPEVPVELWSDEPDNEEAARAVYPVEPRLEGFSGPVDDFGHSWDVPQKRQVMRTPNLVDALLFLVALAIGMLILAAVAGLAEYFHWFGIRNLDAAAKSTPANLGTELAVYGIALGAAIPFFRMVWGKGFFAGLHWGWGRAFRLRYGLFAVAFGCNLLALLVNLVLKFPEKAPIDKMFATTADAWMLAGFGVVVAPFFEEMIFRGFLLPAVATAWDWFVERATGAEPRELDEEGNPQWSAGAMVFAALTVSAPFAWIHSEQVGAAWGPLVLLYCVSLALCAVRLAARSLAASTLTHSAYNLMLFALMFAQTDGFRHMDTM